WLVKSAEHPRGAKNATTDRCYIRHARWQKSRARWIPQQPEEPRHPFVTDRLGKERCFPVEVIAAREKRQQNRGKEDGFLVIKAFEEREENTAKKQNRGQVIRGVESPPDTAGKKKQPGACETCQEMGEFEDRERNQAVEPIQSSQDSGGRA